MYFICLSWAVVNRKYTKIRDGSRISQSIAPTPKEVANLLFGLFFVKTAWKLRQFDRGWSFGYVFTNFHSLNFHLNDDGIDVFTNLLRDPNRCIVSNKILTTISKSFGIFGRLTLHEWADEALVCVKFIHTFLVFIIQTCCIQKKY